jgi:hypothetical protein
VPFLEQGPIPYFALDPDEPLGIRIPESMSMSMVIKIIPRLKKAVENCAVRK